jgi:hypothetical protein
MNLKEARDAINTHVKDLIEVCPHCGARSHIEALWNDCHKRTNRDVEFYVVFRCKPCRRLLLKTFYLEQNPYSEQENLTIKGWDEMFPMSLDDQLGRDEKEFIPTEIRRDYEEALKCQSISANRASCSMFRRALQSALLQIGADPKLDLIKQIEALATLPGDVKDWAHQIRIFGNWGAHPDKDNLKDVGPDDVSEAHDFMSKFLLYVFIMPEKVKMSRQRREKALVQRAPADGAQGRNA